MTKELAIRIIIGDVLGTSEQTREAVEMAVKALSSSDAIELVRCTEDAIEDVLEVLDAFNSQGRIEYTTYSELHDAISMISAKPVRHGHWIGVGQTQFERIFFSQRVFKCSVCGNYLDFDGVNVGRGSANFCPNCGAKMDERSEDVETKHAVETISGWIRLEN